MDTYEIKWTRLQSEILRFFCINTGQSFNVREISRELKNSPTAISNSLKLLEKEALIKIKRSETFNLFSVEFNRENPKAIQYKRAENIRLIYESGLFDELHNSFPGCTIVLFGSYSKGEDAKYSEENQSDIDIAIIGSKNKNLDLTKFNKKLNRKVVINFYESWKSIHKNLKNNILSGILLKGEIEI